MADVRISQLENSSLITEEWIVGSQSEPIHQQSLILLSGFSLVAD